ncbi:MAG: hypothetical protein KDB61_12405, partial [Planctomycetes bacterium]|nr:hypothetical protein [Planctomycetota bacterium]
EWGNPGRPFTFPDLDPGRYVVGVCRGWQGPIVAHQEVELLEGYAEVILQMPEPDLSQVLRVTVVDSGGDIIDGTRFSFKQTRGNGSSSNGVNATRDEEGAYLVQVPGEMHENYFGTESTNAEYSLQVRHEDFGDMELPLKRGQTELAVTFQEPGTLTVTILGYSGSGCEGRLRVAVTPVEEGGNRHYFGGDDRDHVKADGTCEVEGLTPGNYLAVLRIVPPTEQAHSWNPGREIGKVELEIRPGENTLSMGLPSLYNLRVHWADGKEGESLYLNKLQDEDGFFGSNNAEFDARGYAMWYDLPAGDYKLQSWGGENQIMHVTVPCGDVEFVPMIINSMRITITDDQGDFAKLGFRTGDLIVGVDGVDFTSQSEMMALSARMQVKSTEVDIDVLRGNQRISIHVSGADLNGWRKMGAQMEPESR